MFDGAIAASRLGRHAHAGKTLVERLTGRFYTPDVLASDLAVRVTSLLTTYKGRGALSLADPFCGDGRLVGALLAAVSRDERLRNRKFRVLLADLDRMAVEAAVATIGELVRALGLEANRRPANEPSIILGCERTAIG